MKSKSIKFFTFLTFSIFLFSCSTPPLKNQDQLEKERISKNHIKIQRMYSFDYIDGKPIDSAANLINECYYDPKGNEKCLYIFRNNIRELSKICQYDKNDNKTTETWLGRKEFLKWEYYKLIYTYDSLNRLESMRLFNPMGTLYFGHIYNYDIQGRLICDICVDVNYNATGADSLSYKYDSRDAFEKRSYSLGDSDTVKLGQTITYDYDKERHLVEEKTINTKNELISRRTYHYNSDGLKDKETTWDVKTNRPETLYTYKYERYRTIK